MTLKLHHDGKLGSFEGSSGNYNVFSRKIRFENYVVRLEVGRFTLKIMHKHKEEMLLR